jgi:hypothetical protein
MLGMSEKMRPHQITVPLTLEQKEFLRIAAAVDCRTMAGQIRYLIEQAALAAKIEAGINERVDAA